MGERGCKKVLTKGIEIVTLHCNKIASSHDTSHTHEPTDQKGTKMDKKMAEKMSDVTKKMLNSLAGLQKINERTMNELAKQQVQAAESFVSVTTKQIKGLGNLKTKQDMANAQAEIITEVGKSMVDNAKQTMELLSRSQTELAELIERDLKDIAARAQADDK